MSGPLTAWASLPEDEQIALDHLLKGDQFRASTGIDGSTTYGYGALSDCGFWQYPLPMQIVKVIEEYSPRPAEHHIEQRST